MPKRFLHSYFLVFSIVLCSHLALSQTKDSINYAALSGDYIQFSLGYSYQQVKDASLSPLTYAGNMGNIGLGYIYQSAKWRNSIYIMGFGAFQNPQQRAPDNSSRVTTFAGRLHYRLSYRVWQHHKWRLYAGVASTNVWDYRTHNRFGNSSENFTGLANLGPTLHLQRPFDLWGQKWQARYTLDLPVAAYVVRPGFIKPLLIEEPSVQEWAFWGDYSSVFSTLKLAWLLDNGNQILLSYQWEYATYKPLNKVQLAGHHLALSALFKF